VWRNLTRYEFPGPIYLVNPRRTELWDRPCYPDFESLPEPPDHLVVLVPAPNVPELLRSGAAAGARSATVFSSGFGEGGMRRPRHMGASSPPSSPRPGSAFPVPTAWEMSAPRAGSSP
jgi:acyl-CoA synthetase (NDP forming)